WQFSHWRGARPDDRHHRRNGVGGAHLQRDALGCGCRRSGQQRERVLHAGGRRPARRDRRHAPAVDPRHARLQRNTAGGGRQRRLLVGRRLGRAAAEHRVERRHRGAQRRADAADASNAATASFSVTIGGAPIQITTAALAGGRERVAYSAGLTLSGSSIVTWSATGLPGGLKIAAATGRISGTPSTAGTYT